ncbi:TOMM precursor leader peptide-binding protein [Nonomuraea polychroma]|uniref:TOMM precursor leader peptide-binding protein n=1 Tax=Nonomuraea polychroma TaxID=46176 RepID=UPI003D8BFE0D
MTPDTTVLRTRTPPDTVVLGTGRLHAAITAAFTPDRLTASDATLPDGATALLTVSDANDERDYPALTRLAAARRIPWLPVRVDAGWVLLGPAVHPPASGCPTCVARRRDANRADAQGRDAMRARFGEELAARPSGLLTRATATAVAALAAAELDRLRQDAATALTAGALLRMSVSTGLVRRHPFLPDPLCPDCGRRPPDTPEAVRPPRGPARKPAPGVFRVADLAGREEELRETFVDGETGLIQSLVSDARGGSPMAVARLAPARTSDESHHGYGRCDDFPAARATAMVEALERIAGIHPRARRPAVRAAYADVAEQALDPRTLGLYPDDHYDLPGFWFARFDPSREISWVWAYSFGRDAPLLVPESYVYYGPPPDPGLAYESSNGCAAGGCPAEAILYGLLEVAERDAILTTWYARMPMSPVDLDSATDRRIPMTAERLRHRLGYTVEAYVTAMEQGVPVFWVMAVDPAGDPERPKAVCGSAAHLEPEHALRRALVELGPTLEGQLDRYDPARAARLAADSDLVRTLDDHPMVYGHPGAYDRLAFLAAEGPRLALADLPGWPAHDDLTEDLAELVRRYLDSGLDVIAVDTTSPEMKAAGLHAAKVIVPGTVPITFGHRHRRTHGLPRLLSRPRLLGHRAEDLRPEQLNPFPHPFP